MSPRASDAPVMAPVLDLPFSPLPRFDPSKKVLQRMERVEREVEDGRREPH